MASPCLGTRMRYQKSLAIEQRLETALRLIRTGEYATPAPSGRSSASTAPILPNALRDAKLTSRRPASTTTWKKQAGPKPRSRHEQSAWEGHENISRGSASRHEFLRRRPPPTSTKPAADRRRTGTRRGCRQHDADRAFTGASASTSAASLNRRPGVKATVDAPAAHIARTRPGLRGYTRSNLLRMRQFHETYRDNAIVAPLVRQLPWTHNLLILSRSKRSEERELYLRMAASQKWSKRELERQLSGAHSSSGSSCPRQNSQHR